MMKEAAYWIALAHLPKWGPTKINSLIIKFFHENKITIEDFFHLEESSWMDTYLLDEKQINDLKQAKSELASRAFLAESFLNQGYEIIPVTSPEYSKTLKSNLKIAHSPAVLYVKGNKDIMKEKSVAIVGSRDASERALAFTDNIAKQACKDSKVVVSGFAKGVDRQALDSALQCKGRSIIVLPQGIMTFASGFKNYYKQIVGGDVLVISTFFHKAPWKAELAMARNPIIYGLANEIFAAESSDKGGTWSGVIDGLRKGRKIYVRKPDLYEKNANNLLIQKGAIPVDMKGFIIEKTYQAVSGEKSFTAHEPQEAESLDDRIRQILAGRPLLAREIQSKLDIDWSSQKFTGYLKKLEFVEIIKNKGSNLFKLKREVDSTQVSLFD